MKAKRRALAERREIMGHTQETLAEFVGVKPTTVGRWERGESCPQAWCRPKLADALQVSLEKLDRLLAEGQPVEAPADTPGEPVADPEHDLVFLTGVTLTAPAHQWLIQEPGPLSSGLAGRRVSTALVDRFLGHDR